MFRLFGILSISAVFFIYSASAYAVDVTVGAAVNMRAVISAAVGQEMSFGNIDFEPVHTGEIQLGTDGVVQLSGSTSGISLNGGSPSAGDLVVAGDGQSIIEISCESNGVLSSTSANSLNLQNVQFSIDTGQAFGSATHCAGLGTSVASVDLTGNGAPKLLFGGALDVSGNAISVSEAHSTANAGGDPVTVRVVYQ